MERPWVSLRGLSVTIPHKLSALRFVGDAVEPLARKIGAVNTVTFDAAGKPFGMNTDYAAILDSLTIALSCDRADLRGVPVAVLGAGGAARASAFALAAHIDGATLTITNRTLKRAEELAAEVARAHPAVSAITQQDALALLPGIDLVVNASTVGQSGVRHLGGGKATSLEPFSSLVPADPPVLPDEGPDDAVFLARWSAAAGGAIAACQAAAEAALAACPPATAFVDAVYSPDETVLLRQARLRGHRTLNGKGMLIMQAAAGFVQRMARRHLEAAGHDPDALHDRVVAAMEAAF